MSCTNHSCHSVLSTSRQKPDHLTADQSVLSSAINCLACKAISSCILVPGTHISNVCQGGKPDPHRDQQTATGCSKDSMSKMCRFKIVLIGANGSRLLHVQQSSIPWDMVDLEAVKLICCCCGSKVKGPELGVHTPSIVDLHALKIT